jgi:hypothetical protein
MPTQLNYEIAKAIMKLNEQNQNLRLNETPNKQQFIDPSSNPPPFSKI